MVRALFLTLLLLVPTISWSAKIKDITMIEGARENYLVGYGIVTGLEKNGDQTKMYYQTVVNMLEKFGIRVPVNRVDYKNMAAVIVTAKLPPSAKPGMKIDVEVASIGDAKTLQGGVLLLTPLFGPDGNIYAVAQGPVSIGGFNIAGGGGRIQKNHPTTGIIPGGAIVEREVPSGFRVAGLTKFRLNLTEPDIITAYNIQETINRLWPGTARVIDYATIEVNVAPEYIDNPAAFLARVQLIDVNLYSSSKIVVDEKTGTIVMGAGVRILPVAVAHGSITVKVESRPTVSQPLPLSGGTTTVTRETRMTVEESKGNFVTIGERGEVTVGELVNALNKLGVPARDIIAIIRAIKAAGALEGELEVI
ncbi:MAG: flagellar basal body P-ring protein FlgI [Thermosulfidibacteraceae bacterium]